MGFIRNQHRYPLKYWIKRSAAFSLCIVSISIINAIYTDQANFWLNTCVGFVGFFSIIICNLILHIHFDVKDPIKSPIKVKIFGFLVTFTICLSMLALLYCLGTLSPEEEKIIAGSLFNFIFLSAFRAAVIDFIVLLWLYFLMTDYFKNQLELERSKLDKLKERAVNQMLRQQVQPHFLFNALSSLKSLIKKDSAKAESYLLQLSDYLRGSFMTSEDGLATVQQELKLCEDYLSMQKLRFNEAIQFDIQVSENVQQDLLPIFSLQPLVDNALKHNFYTIDHPLFITIREQGGWIVVSNNVCLRKPSMGDNNNYGLNNLKERFSYYLQDSVIINENGTTFEVRLKLIQHENHHH
ncbi:sensor histidine kinase [Sphingobacterium chuzhouense]|uniref:Histidine kinase n=1 Tax=Sphingobacterium chuzhouense TaxID=1742264 RepID=A0ABR7XWU0_9SPHI|nr:histidine kinase [Sphingobacterium chuzhouense]MBD1423502.1 histidine kinase [Sphingobacterium chuzhouense]